MTTIVNQTTSNQSLDFLEFTDIQKLKHEEDQVSERALLLAEGVQSKPVIETAKKVAYFWMKAPLDDEAFFSPENIEARNECVESLKKNNYTVITFDTNQALFDHIKKDPSKIDLLVISGHGNTSRLEDLEVIGDSIINRVTLQKDLLQVSTILKQDSTVVLDSCLTGNATVENNFAKVMSEAFPQSKVLASQLVTHHPFWPIMALDKTGQTVLSTVGYASYDQQDNMLLIPPMVYKDGKELSGQKPVPLPPPTQREVQQNSSPLIQGTILLLGLLGAYFIGPSLSSLIS